MIYLCATCSNLSSHVVVVKKDLERSGKIVPECGCESHNFILLEHGREVADCDDYVEKGPESEGFLWAGLHGLDAEMLQALYNKEEAENGLCHNQTAMS